MIALPIQVGSTDQSIPVELRDVNGSPLTGKAYNTSGFTCYYRKGATGAMTQLTLATQTVTGAHSDGGFVELDATNAPGCYRLDLSDTMVAALGITEIFFNGIAGLDPCKVQIPVVAYNPQDAVRLGVTALPNANAAAIGGLLTAPTTANVGLADLSRILGTALTETSGQIAAAFKKFFDKATPTGTINSLPDAVAGASGGVAIVGSNMGSASSVTAGVTVTTNNDKTGYGLSSAAVQAIWDAATTALTTVGSIGKWILDKIDVVLSTRLASASYTAPLDAAGTRSAVGLASANLDTQLTTILTRLGVPASDISTIIAAINAKTVQLTFTNPNELDANIKSVADTTVTGSGTEGDPWGP